MQHLGLRATPALVTPPWQETSTVSAKGSPGHASNTLPCTESVAQTPQHGSHSSAPGQERCSEPWKPQITTRKISKCIRALWFGRSAWQLTGHREVAADHQSRPQSLPQPLNSPPGRNKGLWGHHKTENHLEGLQGHHDRIQRVPGPAWGDSQRPMATMGGPGAHREIQGHRGETQRDQGPLWTNPGPPWGPETPRRNKEPQRGHPEQPWGVFSGLQDHHKGILRPHGGILAQLLSSSTENSASTGRPCLLHPRSTQGRRQHRPRW